MRKFELSNGRCSNITSCFLTIDDEMSTMVRVDYTDPQNLTIEFVDTNNITNYEMEVYEFVKKGILNGEIFLPIFVPLSQENKRIEYDVDSGYVDFGDFDFKKIKSFSILNHVETPMSV